MLEEYIVNTDTDLKNTHSTLIALDKSGHSFFKGRTEKNERYVALVSKYEKYIDEAEDKLREVGLSEAANHFTQNKKKVNKLLKELNFSVEDLENEWFKHKN